MFAQEYEAEACNLAFQPLHRDNPRFQVMSTAKTWNMFFQFKTKRVKQDIENGPSKK